jgi:quercetin dioxygenase-like cupin family protein
MVWMPGGVRTEIHLEGADTGGAFCLLVDHPPAGWALPPHRHAGEAETIHVVAGTFAMEVGGETVEAGPGATVHVPRGVVHSGRCVDGPGQRVVIFSPAGMEAFFRETGADAPGAEFDLSAVLAAAVRNGWRFEGV